MSVYSGFCGWIFSYSAQCLVRPWIHAVWYVGGESFSHQGVRCAAMPCGGECFSPAGAYDSAWDSVKPMKGKCTVNYIQYPLDVGCVCMLKKLEQQLLRFCADNHNYFQSKLKGMGRTAVCAAAKVQVCGETVELPQLHLVAAWLQYIGMVVDVGCVGHEGYFLGPCT